MNISLSSYDLDLPPSPAKRICFFGSASDGTPDYAYGDEIVELTNLLGWAGCDFILGAGTTGHMGEGLEGAHKANAHITGVIPDFIVSKERRPREDKRERGEEKPWDWIHEGLILEGKDKQLLLQTRQRIMVENADAILITTGGDVTFAELFEVLGWCKYRLIDKPVVLYSPNGQWEPLEQMRYEISLSGFNSSYSKRTGGQKTRAPYVVANDYDTVFKIFGLDRHSAPEPRRPQNHEKRWRRLEVERPKIRLVSMHETYGPCLQEDAPTP